MMVFILKAIGFMRSPLFKWGLGLLALAGVVFFAVRSWNNYKQGLIDQGHAQGVLETTEKYKKLVERTNQQNRKVEQAVKGAVDQFSEEVQEDIDRMTSKAQTQQQIVERIIERTPSQTADQCITPKEIIDARNAVRALGPTEEGK